jgi:hypothetical protein
MKKGTPQAARSARYLDLLALSPGDLILSRGSDPVSKVLASQSDGPFSHVAIVRSFAQRFEALEDGVGLTNHRADRMERRDGRLRVLMRVEDEECLVLRHRDAVVDDDQVRERYARAVYRYIGVRYSSLDRLLLALPNSHRLHPLAAPIVKRLRRARKVSLRHRLRPPGLFCSEVAVEVYAEMGWDLPGVSQAVTVSPNHLHKLIQPAGPLAAVTEAVVEADDGGLIETQDPQAAEMLDILKDYPPGRFKVDEMIKEKDSMYAHGVVARHLNEIASLAMGKYIEHRREKRPARIAKLEAFLAELNAIEAQGREAEKAGLLDRKESPVPY